MLSAGGPSPRTEVVYDIEPFRAALRQGGWKLVLQATLPSRTELFDVAKDPGEQHDLSAKHPEKVAALKTRIEALSREAVKPLILDEAIGAVKPALFGVVVFPEESQAIHAQP